MQPIGPGSSVRESEKISGKISPRANMRKQTENWEKHRALSSKQFSHVESAVSRFLRTGVIEPVKKRTVKTSTKPSQQKSLPAVNKNRKTRCTTAFAQANVSISKRIDPNRYGKFEYRSLKHAPEKVLTPVTKSVVSSISSEKSFADASTQANIPDENRTIAECFWYRTQFSDFGKLQNSYMQDQLTLFFWCQEVLQNYAEQQEKSRQLNSVKDCADAGTQVNFPDENRILAEYCWYRRDVLDFTRLQDKFVHEQMMLYNQCQLVMQNFTEQQEKARQFARMHCQNSCRKMKIYFGLIIFGLLIIIALLFLLALK